MHTHSPNPPPPPCGHLGYLVKPGDILLIEAEFCVGGLEGGVEEVSATDNYWEEETREAAQHPTMYKTAFTTRNFSGLKCQ